MSPEVRKAPAVVCLAYSRSEEDAPPRPEGGSIQNEVVLMEEITAQATTDKISLCVFVVVWAIWTALGVYGIERAYRTAAVESESNNSVIGYMNMKPFDGRRNVFEYNLSPVNNIAKGNVDIPKAKDMENNNKNLEIKQELLMIDSLYLQKENVVNSNKNNPINGTVIISNETQPDNFTGIITIFDFFFSDIREARYVIYGSMGATATISVVYIFLLYWTAEITMWLSFIIVGLALLYGLVCCIEILWCKDIPPLLKKNIEKLLCLHPFAQWLILTGVTLLILITYIIMVYRSRRRIIRGGCLAKESSRLMRSKWIPAVLATLFWPVHVITLFQLFFVFIGVKITEDSAFNDRHNQTCVCQGITREIIVGKDCDSYFIKHLCEDCARACHEYKIPLAKDIAAKAFYGFNVFVFLWITVFLVHLKYMIISGNMVQTLYKKGKRSSFLSNIFRPTYTIFRYHLGTVALGSLVALLTFVIKAVELCACHGPTKIVLEFVFRRQKHQLKKRIRDPRLKILTSDSLLRLCRHIYLFTIVFGTGFTESGIRVLAAWNNKLLRVCSVVKFFLFLTQLTLSVAVAVQCYQIIHDGGTMQYFEGVAPAIIIFMTSMIVSGIFFADCRTAAETIVVAYLIDQSMNNDADQKFQMPKRLVKSLSIIRKKKGHGSSTATTEDHLKY